MSVLRSTIVAVGLMIVPLSAGLAQPQQAAPPPGAAAPGNAPVPQALPGMAIAPPSAAHPATAAEASAPAAAPAPAPAATAVLPHDLSPWGMFMAADIVVKSVMIGLAFASVVTWTVWLAKSIELITHNI